MKPKKKSPTPPLPPEWVKRLELMALETGESPAQLLERLVRRAWVGRGGGVSERGRVKR